MRLTVNVDIGVGGIESGGYIIFNAFDNLSIKFAVIDWRGKRMKIWDKHVDIGISSVFVRKINHRRIGTEKIS